MAKRTKHKPWYQLKHDKCPNCNQELAKGMFDDDYIACQNCGFIIKDSTKDLLVKRDHSDE